MQIKNTWRYHLTPVRVAISDKSTSVGEDIKKREHGDGAGGEYGGWVGGSWAHLLVPPVCFQLIFQQVSWTISRFSVDKNFWSQEALHHPVRDFINLRGKYPVQGACSRGEIKQKAQLSGSLPSQSRTLVPHRELPIFGRVHKVWET